MHEVSVSSDFIDLFITFIFLHTEHTTAERSAAPVCDVGDCDVCSCVFSNVLTHLTGRVCPFFLPLLLLLPPLRWARSTGQPAKVLPLTKAYEDASTAEDAHAA